MNYKLLTVVRCLLTLKKEINHLNNKHYEKVFTFHCIDDLGSGID